MKKLKAIWRILRAKQWFYQVFSQDKVCFDWDFLGNAPKQAPAEFYADLILRQSAYCVQGIKLSADKIFRAYHHQGNTDRVIADLDVRRLMVSNHIEKLVWEDGEIIEIKFKQ